MLGEYRIKLSESQAKYNVLGKKYADANIGVWEKPFLGNIFHLDNWDVRDYWDTRHYFVAGVLVTVMVVGGIACYIVHNKNKEYDILDKKYDILDEKYDILDEKYDILDEIHDDLREDHKKLLGEYMNNKGKVKKLERALLNSVAENGNGAGDGADGRLNRNKRVKINKSKRALLKRVLMNNGVDVNPPQHGAVAGGRQVRPTLFRFRGIGSTGGILESVADLFAGRELSEDGFFEWDPTYNGETKALNSVAALFAEPV